MEAAKPPKPKLQIGHVTKRSTSSNSDSLTNVESPHSPLRFHSPLRSDHGDPDPQTIPEPEPEPEPEHDHDPSPYASPIASPFKSPPPHHPPAPHVDNSKAIVPSPATAAAAVGKVGGNRSQQPEVVVNRAVREDSVWARRVGPDGSVMSVNRRYLRKNEVVNVAELGFRVSEVVLCLISFSVMAADKTQGWSGDSFDRYKEYRYCLSMNVIGFVYAGFQVCDMAYYLVTGNHLAHHRLFNFVFDQILAYLLISASSSAATRVDDWQSNWGKDEFTGMATASISISFLAFFAFAISSLISGYNFCNPGWT